LAHRTGNIACDLNGSTTPPEATCEVREHSYQPEVKPTCNPAWANSFRLVQGRTVEVNCYSGPVVVVKVAPTRGAGLIEGAASPAVPSGPVNGLPHFPQNLWAAELECPLGHLIVALNWLSTPS